MCWAETFEDRWPEVWKNCPRTLQLLFKIFTVHFIGQTTNSAPVSVKVEVLFGSEIQWNDVNKDLFTAVCFVHIEVKSSLNWQCVWETDKVCVSPPAFLTTHFSLVLPPPLSHSFHLILAHPSLTQSYVPGFFFSLLLLHRPAAADTHLLADKSWVYRSGSAARDSVFDQRLPVMTHYDEQDTSIIISSTKYCFWEMCRSLSHISDPPSFRGGAQPTALRQAGIM